VSPELYPWHQAQWQQLANYIELRRIPQALLLLGGSGDGADRLADCYTRAILCRSPRSNHLACGTCDSCKLADAQTHPDYLAIEPDEPGKAIGIDKIRQLIVKLALTPQFEQYRVVLIKPADLLNNASANAFLKCLEEPNERTCLILLTDKPSQLPATIRSRCQTLNCAVPDQRQSESWLEQQGVKDDMRILLRMAQDKPVLAKQFAESNALAVRRQYFQAWSQLADGKQNPLVLAEQWQKLDTAELETLLQWMAGWLSDVVKCAHQLDSEALLNPDLKNPLHALAQRIELNRLFAHYDDLLTMRSQLYTQLNKQMLMEQLLIAWRQLFSR